MGFQHWAELGALIAACIIGVSGIRLLSQGLSRPTAAEPEVIPAPATTAAAAAPVDVIEPARVEVDVVAPRVARVNGPERFARLADELRLRFTPVTVEPAQRGAVDDLDDSDLDLTGPLAIDTATA